MIKRQRKRNKPSLILKKIANKGETRHSTLHISHLKVQKFNPKPNQDCKDY